jgi:hypothetical protein
VTDLADLEARVERGLTVDAAGAAARYALMKLVARARQAEETLAAVAKLIERDRIGPA